MEIAQTILNRSIDALMWLACAAGALMMTHITVDVFCRNFLNAPILGTVEIVSAYYMVAIAFLPLAYIARGEGHMVVELFTRNLPQRRLARLDALVCLASGVYILAFAWFSTVAAIDKTEEGEVRETAAGFMAVWPSRWILTLGIALMAVHAVICGVRALRTVAPARATHERD